MNEVNVGVSANIGSTLSIFPLHLCGRISDELYEKQTSSYLTTTTVCLVVQFQIGYGLVSDR